MKIWGRRKKESELCNQAERTIIAQTSGGEESGSGTVSLTSGKTVRALPCPETPSLSALVFLFLYFGRKDGSVPYGKFLGFLY